MKLFGNKRNAAHCEKKSWWGRKKREEASETFDAHAVSEEREVSVASARAADPVRKKRSGGSRMRRVLAVLLVLVLVSAGGIYALWSNYVVPPTLPQWNPTIRPTPGHNPDDLVIGTLGTEEPQRLRPFTVLIAGQDNVGSIGLTDVLMLANVDVENGSIDVMSIPRDTVVDLPWEYRKINGVFAITGSIDRLVDEVERMVGFRPDFYIALNLRAFAELVDVIDGVHFNVPRRMVYDDPYDWPPLHIDLWPGYQTLNGNQAIQLVRWRQNNDGSGLGDMGRIANQQAFLGALAGELLQARNVTRIPTLARIFTDNVDTDIPLGTLVWLANQMYGLDTENIRFHTAPTEYNVYIFGGSHGVVDLEPWLEMINAYINPTPWDVELENIRVVARVNGVFQAVGGDQSLTAFYPEDEDIGLGYELE
ncbi:MAG: LCP family protein [Oscillospiraceae bacterium]|nr:LCP family protein [Oscillospiraceae bacterium]